MTIATDRATLLLYRRRECSLCDETRLVVQHVLEQRATRGEPVPSLREVEIDDRPALIDRYGSAVPVLVLHGAELPLAISGRQIQTFLDRTLGRLV